MKQLRITLAQINTTVGDLDGNLNRCCEAVKKAAGEGTDLVVFPELALTGYPPEDLLLRPGFLRKGMRALERFAEQTGDVCAVMGFAEAPRMGHPGFCMQKPGTPLHAKAGESSEWDEGVAPTCSSYKLGTPLAVYNSAAVVSGGSVRCVYRKMFLPNYGVFDEKRYFTPGTRPVSFTLGDVIVGLTICEDIWVDDGPSRELSRGHRADLIVNISASPFHAGKILERENLLRRRTVEADAPIVYVNLVGGQDELVFDGGSMVFDREGTCLLRAPSFTETFAVIDMEFEKLSSASPQASAHIPLRRKSSSLPPAQPVIVRHLDDEEEILEALVLGARDYICKNGFSKAVVGLSGGVDSSLVAAIAVDALGKENVIGVTMPSRYTSSGTYTDAGRLSGILGIRLIELPIHDIFEAFVRTLAVTFQGTLPDVSEENIQARIRGTLLMALSNKFGWLVLTTGNKSETATGYCTLYGDMAGGFAVIKDVPKTMVYRICRLINRRAGREIIPESVLVRPPTAELRPDQKDSDSLPPYEVLDPILKLYIEDDLGIEEIAARGFDPGTVSRVMRLCDGSEYKRRQAPPGVKITPRSFGRDRRLPLTNRFRYASSGEWVDAGREGAESEAEE
jgi:NAD+ synthase (glutamine-hydrolysing)